MSLQARTRSSFQAELDLHTAAEIHQVGGSVPILDRGIWGVLLCSPLLVRQVVGSVHEVTPTLTILDRGN